MSKDQEKDFWEGGKLLRRNFLQYTALTAGGLAASPLVAKAGLHHNRYAEEGLFWYQRPLRIMHTVLREIDAKSYDANKVVDYMKKGGYNTLCVNAGGIVDFFQNPLPAANINRIMGQRDILKEITTACKAAGFKVIARIDFRGSEEHVYKKFPDWYMKTKDQNPVVMTWTKPELYESCYSGQHRNEYANEYVTYVLKNYAVDGIWHNSPGFRGTCFCQRCQASYKEKNRKSHSGSCYCY